MKARIAEVFESVQGEGLYLGERQLFVRFFGCNLCCRFCDTQLSRFIEYEPQELFEEIELFPPGFHSISFTGGEPLLQKDFLKEVLKLTSSRGYKNYLETNGTLPGELQEVIDYIDIVAMDLKLPSSTGMGYFWGLHSRFLKIASKKEVLLKAIICQTTEEKDLRVSLALIKEVNRRAILILQPNSYEHSEELDNKLQHFKNICINDGVLACIIPQMHKLMGVK